MIDTTPNLPEVVRGPDIFERYEHALIDKNATSSTRVLGQSARSAMR